MDFNEQFYTHIYASEFQKGALFVQNFKPITFHSRKITGQQQRYRVMQKKFLSIVETLKEFCTIFISSR